MGTRYNRLIEVVLTSTHNLCFVQKYEKYQNFLAENFHFLVVKFSVYLNRFSYCNPCPLDTSEKRKIFILILLLSEALVLKMCSLVSHFTVHERQVGTPPAHLI